MYSTYTLLQECSFLHETDLQANLTELQFHATDTSSIEEALEDEIYFYDDKDELRYK